ncbi:hypothetical protein LguiB_022650 [Lonicera macranthoides]
MKLIPAQKLVIPNHKSFWHELNSFGTKTKVEELQERVTALEARSEGRPSCGFVPMAFGGIKQTAAYGELVSVGGLNANINKKLSATISTIQSPPFMFIF